jgi:dienelactone hydrolase
VFLSRIQPYAAYVPEAATGGGPSPLVVLLHSLGELQPVRHLLAEPDPRARRGERRARPDAGGPGPSGWYQREAKADVFEAWRDLERRYPADRDRVTLSGYLMGGYGTFKLGAQYPDLFGRGFAVVRPASEDPLEGPTDGRVETPGLVQDGLLGGESGPDRSVTSIFSNDPENTLRISDNLRHVPLLLWNGVIDELVPALGPVNQARRLREHDYRHELNLFPTVDHLLLALRDRWDRCVDYLDRGRVTRTPARVTYRRVPDFDPPEFGLVHDGAHWVNDIGVRADAVSHADGYAAPRVEEYAGSGTRPFPHTRRGVRWQEPLEATSSANRPSVWLAGVALYIAAARLSLDGLALDVESKGPATLRLVDDGGERTVWERGRSSGRSESVAGGRDPPRRRVRVRPSLDGQLLDGLFQFRQEGADLRGRQAGLVGDELALELSC